MSDDTREYIGDGVYVEHDGFGIWLNANHPEHPTDRVYLEPLVLERLNEYAQRMREERARERSERSPDHTERSITR